MDVIDNPQGSLFELGRNMVFSPLPAEAQATLNSVATIGICISKANIVEDIQRTILITVCVRLIVCVRISVADVVEDVQRRVLVAVGITRGWHAGPDSDVVRRHTTSGIKDASRD